MRVLTAEHHEGFRDGQRWTVRIEDGNTVRSVEARGATREEAEADAFRALAEVPRLSTDEREALGRSSAAIQKGLLDA